MGSVRRRRLGYHIYDPSRLKKKKSVKVTVRTKKQQSPNKRRVTDNIQVIVKIPIIGPFFEEQYVTTLHILP